MDEQIRYQFARFKDFYDATKQHVTAESEEPLSFQVPKQAFAKGASLGKVKSPLRKLRKRSVIPEYGLHGTGPDGPVLFFTESRLSLSGCVIVTV